LGDDADGVSGAGLGKIVSNRVDLGITSHSACAEDADVSWSHIAAETLGFFDSHPDMKLHVEVRIRDLVPGEYVVCFDDDVTFKQGAPTTSFSGRFRKGRARGCVFAGHHKLRNHFDWKRRH
jgi:hypothetical protein